jgi:2'-5' RNA ligase
MEPLILTMRFADREAAFFDRLRQEHFPAEHNFIAAHLTLFHHLPGEERLLIERALAPLTAETPPIAYRVTGLRRLGKGVSYAIASPGLKGLRSQIASLFVERLTPQDRSGFTPHVTIQNKVGTAVAKALHSDLSAGFTEFHGVSPGLDLWTYLGGPWRHEAFFDFKPNAADRNAASYEGGRKI